MIVLLITTGFLLMHTFMKGRFCTSGAERGSLFCLRHIGNLQRITAWSLITRRPHHTCSALTASLFCYKAVLRESRELHGDLESMAEKVELLSEVLQVESMSQQVCELSRHTEELQQSIKTRLQSLEDADKVQKKTNKECHLFVTFYFTHELPPFNAFTTFD